MDCFVSPRSGLSRNDTLKTHALEPDLYGVLVVSDVVVVTGLDTVVWLEVVVVVVSGVVAQAHSETSAARTRDERIRFFMSMFVCWRVD